MSNYPYYPPVPPQGQPVPGNGYAAYSGSAPPQHAPPQPQYPQAPPQAQPSYQHQPYQQPPLQYQQPAYEQPPPQPPRPPQQQYSHGPRPSDPAAPALPPRRTGTANRLMAQSTLNFPPPPRSPNRRPGLPPRPQQSQPPQPPRQHAQVPRQQAYGQPPAYPATAPPASTTASSHETAYPTTTQNYVPPPPPAPPTVSNPIYQPTYYPPPPPGPPPPVQPVSPVSTVSPLQTPPQPSSLPAAAAVPVPPPTQSPPQIHVQDTGVSTVSAASTGSGSMEEMQSMVERLNLKPPTPPSAPEPLPEPRAFVAELCGESGSPHVETAEPPVTAPTPSATHTPPPPAPLQEQYTTAQPSATPQQCVPSPQPAPPAQEQAAPPQQAASTAQQQHAPPPQAAAPSRETSAPPPFRAVTHCIDTPVTFSTWWYAHDGAPDYTICSKCYMDYIHPTVFQTHFAGRYLTDGAERRCRFNVPRVTKQLLPDAVCRGTLDSVILFMNQRVRIKDCKGGDGATGAQGMKWYAVRNNQLPGFVACEACYQDIVCMSQFASSLEEAPGPGERDTWICDLSVPYIRREFELRTKLDDWPTFLQEAKARLGMPACPKTTPMAVRYRKWFVPVESQGPPDAVLCVACYCDYILNSGQEGLWQQQPTHATQTTNICIMGLFHLRMALSAAAEDKQWPLFWTSVNRIAYQEKACTAAGIVDGNWYTLPSQPGGYNVCGACHAGIVQSLHLEPFFVPRTSKGPSPGEAHLCSFNIKAPRFASYVRYMLQTWFTADCAAWDAYASRCAAFPPCPRNNDHSKRAWYGWPECVICVDCYMEVVRGTALDTPEHMTFHKPTVLEQPHICEMYSPRMRTLYQAACSTSPPSTADLFAYVEQRRLVYWQTIPRCRQMLMEERLLANQISMARISSTFYTGAGGIVAAVSHPHHHHTYGAPGVGYGFENAFTFKGAQYNAEANAMSSQLGGSKILIVGQLEQQWQAIE